MIKKIKSFCERKIKELNNEKYRKSEENFCKSNYLTHITYYKIGNAGDTCLSQCVRKTFEKNNVNSSWKIINVSDEVNDKTINYINNSNGLILGGGGLFLPDTNKNNISGWQWAISKDDVNKINKPIIIFSVGYNYFRGQEPSPLFTDSLINICEKASFIGLRNNGSVNEVKKLLPDSLKEKVIYQPCTTTLIRKIYSDLPAKKHGTKNICLNMAFDRSEMRFGKNKEAILNKVAKGIKEIENMGYKIHFAAHVRSDFEFTPYLDKFGIEYTKNDVSAFLPNELFEFYNNMDLVLGMRGHAQMIPFGLNCQIISLGTHEKMKWFLEDIGAPEWHIELTKDTDSLDRRIADTFKAVHIDNNKETDKKLLQAQDRLWSITQKNLKIIKELTAYEK